MANYIGIHCPVCSKRFVEEDDVVVCPICGAPHHRACYQQLGHCTLQDQHSPEYVWEHPAPAQTEQKEPPQIKCASCGTPNPINGIFCQNCGSQLKRVGGQNPPEHPFGGQTPVFPNAYTMAFGGLSPEEKIDGVSARDIALYVGANSHYYLPRFKLLSQKGGISLNFAAFFFSYLYYFYRKMYLVGSIFLLLFLIIQIPSIVVSKEYAAFVLANWQDISIGIYPVFEPQNHLWAYQLLPFVRYAMLLICLGASLVANRVYLKQAVGHVRKIKTALMDADGKLDDRVYTEQLALRGRTNKNAVIILATVLIVSYFAVSFSIALSVL